EGREAMRGYGLRPPGQGPVFLPLASLTRGSQTATCPFCGSADSVLESAFGPTLCRSTHFCRAGRNAFEAFKPKGETARKASSRTLVLACARPGPRLRPCRGPSPDPHPGVQMWPVSMRGDPSRGLMV